MRHKKQPSSSGFTLIELLMAMAIVAILAAIAYPFYQEQIRKSRRTDAQGVLFQNAQFMERLYTETSCYNPGGSDNDDCSNPVTAGALTLPHPQSPMDGDSKYYDLTLASLTATGYSLQAAPRDSQFGDRCGDLTLNNVGQKGASESDCWRK